MASNEQNVLDLEGVATGAEDVAGGSANPLSDIPEDHVLVPTAAGVLHVTVQGHPTVVNSRTGEEKPRLAMITYPDLGLHHANCWYPFFGRDDIKRLIFPAFCVYHIDPPGLEEGAEDWPEETPYPTWEEMINQIEEVREYFGIDTFFSLGAGAGAVLFTHYMAVHPYNTLGNILISPTAKGPGWLEWGYQKAAEYTLWMFGVSGVVQKHLIERYFSWQTIERYSDLTESYKREIELINAQNLWRFIDSYMARPDISVELAEMKATSILYVGNECYYLDDTIEMLSNIPTNKTSWIRVDEAGHLCHLESPGVFYESMKYFFHGRGYLVNYYDEN